MEFSHSLIGSDALKAAINPNPLVVSPNTPLLEVIAQMSQARGVACGLLDGIDTPDHLKALDEHPHELHSMPSEHQSSQAPSSPARQASCVLVVNNASECQNSAGAFREYQSGQSAKDCKVVGIFTERDIVSLVAKGADLAQFTIKDVMVSPVISLAESEFRDIFAPLFLFRRYRIRHLLVVDDRDRPIGIISPASIRSVLRPANLLKLRRVSDIMAHDVVCANYTESILKTAQLMTHHRVSCVVITEADEERGALPIGIVTERDIVQLRTLELDLSIQVGTVMSSPLFLLKPDDSLWTAHQEMQRLKVRRLVVSWNWGKGLGIVTQTSLLRAFDPLEMYGVLETLQTTIEQLQVDKQLPTPQAESETVEIDPSAMPASVGPLVPAVQNGVEHSSIAAESPMPTPALHVLSQSTSPIAPGPSLVAVVPTADTARPLATDPSLSSTIRAIETTTEVEASNAPVVVPPLGDSRVAGTERDEPLHPATNPMNHVVDQLRQAEQQLTAIQSRLYNLQCVDRDRSAKDGILSELNTLAHHLRTLEQDVQPQRTENHDHDRVELG